jgi:hypothetical protein
MGTAGIGVVGVHRDKHSNSDCRANADVGP